MTAKKGKRSDGESSIYQDDDGRWHGFVSMGTKAGGVRDRRHVSGKTRAAVVAKVRKLEEKRDAGITGAAGKAPTVELWLKHWLETIASRRCRATTTRGYESMIRVRITPEIGHHRIDRLQPEHVEAAYLAWEADGLSPATALLGHRILSRALKVAMQRGKVARNVCTLVDAPSVVRAEVEPLTTDDARLVLAAGREGRNSARWSVALALGARQGEALGLAWPAVDLAAKPPTLTVRQTLQRIPWKHGCGDEPCGRKRGAECPERHGGGLVIGEPKSRAGRRTVILPEQLAKELRAHRTAQRAERLKAGPLWKNEHDLVFTQPDGHPIDPRRDWDDWKALLKKAGVRDARLHDARHTCATLLLVQGVAARVVMEILGHSQIGLTLNTYSHVAPELATGAAKKVGTALWGAEEGAVATKVAPSRGRKRRA